MSDRGEPSGEPTDDALPDLFGGASGWDDPLPDLAEPAGHGRRDAGAGGAGGSDGSDGDDEAAPLPDLGGASADEALPDLGDPSAGPALPDLGGRVFAAADLAPSGDGAGLDDMTRRPRRPRGSRRAPRAERGTAVGPEPGPDGDGAAGRADGAPTAGPGPAGSGRNDPEAARTGPGPDGPEMDVPEPLGLASGGLAGGLEPGTLFGPPDPPAGAASARGRRGGRRRTTKQGDDGAASPGATEPERPLTAEERLQHALKLAYRHLTKRDRTVSEVRAHLEKREVDEASIAGALAELVEFGYLDDERYAARFVEDKRRLEGWGHLRIEQGLRRTGVPREVADRALSEDPLRGDEDELAVETLEGRLAGQALEDDRARQKALRLLATKGYPLDTAYAAVRAYERRCAERADG